jgi:hypothetical protein
VYVTTTQPAYLPASHQVAPFTAGGTTTPCTPCQCKTSISDPPHSSSSCAYATSSCVSSASPGGSIIWIRSSQSSQVTSVSA